LNPVRSVERALKMLFLISQSDTPLRLTEIANSTDLDKSTVHRLLLTLEAFQLVQRNPNSKRYGPGPGIWRISNAGSGDLKSISRPHMELLRRTTKETVTLVCPRGLERIVVDFLEAPHELSVVPMRGTIQPVYAGASGKVFMAHFSEKKRRRIVQLTNLKPVNPMVTVDIKPYLASLDDVVEKGYAYTVGDVTVGAFALAAPIFDGEGILKASIVVRGPEVRVSDNYIKKLAPMVVLAANEISRELGHQTALDTHT
jgi:DNA-binding IclR family transcriptional regulator